MIIIMIIISNRLEAKELQQEKENVLSAQAEAVLLRMLTTAIAYPNGCLVVCSKAVSVCICVCMYVCMNVYMYV